MKAGRRSLKSVALGGSKAGGHKTVDISGYLHGSRPRHVVSRSRAVVFALGLPLTLARATDITPIMGHWDHDLAMDGLIQAALAVTHTGGR